MLRGPPARHAWSTLYVALELCSVPGEDRIGCPHLPTLQTRTWQPYKCSSSSHTTNFSHTELFKKHFFLPTFLTLPRSCDNPQVTHLHSPAVRTFPLLKIPKPNVQSVLHSKYPRLLFSHGRRGAKNSFLLDDETL